MAGSKISRSPTRWSYEKEVGDIYGKIVVGSSGAVTSIQGAGIGSVVLNSAGNYTITLSATYQRLLMASVCVLSPAATVVAQSQIFQTVATMQSTFKSAGTITIQLLDFAGVAVNAASGANILFKLEVRFSPSTVFDA